MAPRRRILIIDDSGTIRKLVQIALASVDVIVEMAETGTAGIERARALEPDCILLDFVLPDMKGSDVCARLQGQESTARIPVLVMTAKHDNVRGLFAGFPNVVDFVAKPFTAQLIHARVLALLASLTPATASPAPRPSTPVPPPAPGGVSQPPAPLVSSPPPAVPAAQKRLALANALYPVFKDRLARIPEWSRELGSQAPGSFYARRVLSVEFVDRLVATVLPEAGRPGSATSVEGSTHVLPLMDLLETIGKRPFTGSLDLRMGEAQVRVYLSAGRVLLATDSSSEGPLPQPEIAHVPPPRLALALETRRATGEPVLAQLAAGGLVPTAVAIRLLLGETRRVISAALARGPWRFAASEHPLPAWVTSHGHAVSLAQLQLDRLRLVQNLAALEQAFPDPHVVFDRAEGFTDRVRELELDAAERRVLARVDGRAPIRELVARSELARIEALGALLRLETVDLVRRKLPVRAEAPALPVAVVLEPDREGVRDPLEEFLGRRQPPYVVRAVDHARDLPGLVSREHARLLFVNADAAGVAAEDAARGTRASLDNADTRLVALLESAAPDREKALAAAGFDLVLVKPFPLRALDALLASRPDPAVPADPPRTST